MPDVRYGLGRARGKGRKRQTTGDAEDSLANDLTLAGGVLATFVRQHPYAPPRKLAADFAWPEHMLIVEVQGGVFTGQAHGSVGGILADNARLNTATLHGWRVLRFIPDDTDVDHIAETLDVIERALAVGDDR